MHFTTQIGRVTRVGVLITKGLVIIGIYLFFVLKFASEITGNATGLAKK